MTDDSTTPQLRRRPLGRSGCTVSELCLGTMTFGHLQDAATTEWIGLPQVSVEQAHRLMDVYREHGGNFIDTANVYGKDRASERAVGSWLQRRGCRGDMVVATKVRFGVGSDAGVNGCGLSRRHITQSVDASLEALACGTIDLLQIHAWDVGTPIEETWRALSDLVRIGKVHNVGVSNVHGRHLERIMALARDSGMERCVTLQPLYNVYDRGVELELQPGCVEHSVGILPWSPLAGGVLSGRYSRADAAAPAPEGSRVAWADSVKWKATSWEARRSDERLLRVLDALHEVSAELGEAHSVAQVSLRWLLQKPAVVAPIVGARSEQNLRDCLAAGTGDWELSEEQMAKLDEAGQLETVRNHLSLHLV